MLPLGHPVYDVKFLALLGAPYIYYISRLRVKLVRTTLVTTESTEAVVYPSYSPEAEPLDQTREVTEQQQMLHSNSVT
jgi:hypothetical protein